jgi:indolepyruvate ferredoxin oxidoreductase beta subunit
MKYDLLLCGVGGQGIVTLSEIVATAAVSKDLKTIVTQDRGLAQRGGSVKAHVRIGDVHSPMIPKGHAHALLSLEIWETLGYAEYLNPETVIAAAITVIEAVGGGGKNKTDSEPSADPQKLIEQMGASTLTVDADNRAAQSGSPRGANLFMLGVIYGMDPRIAAAISAEEISAAIRSVIRRKPEDNVAVFLAGMEYGRTKKSA